MYLELRENFKIKNSESRKKNQKCSSLWATQGCKKAWQIVEFTDVIAGMTSNNVSDTFREQSGFAPIFGREWLRFHTRKQVLLLRQLI